MRDYRPPPRHVKAQATALECGSEAPVLPIPCPEGRQLALPQSKDSLLGAELAVEAVEGELSRHGRLPARTQSGELAGQLHVRPVFEHLDPRPYSGLRYRLPADVFGRTWPAMRGPTGSARLQASGRARTRIRVCSMMMTLPASSASSRPGRFFSSSAA